jgi:hypothetical protein
MRVGLYQELRPKFNKREELVELAALEPSCCFEKKMVVFLAGREASDKLHVVWERIMYSGQRTANIKLHARP